MTSSAAVHMGRNAAVTKAILRQIDENTIDTGRYEIIAKEGEVIIRDRHTNTEVKAWGDPHLITSDGDKAQFHKENLTLDLEDGTKITIKVTDTDDQGIALLDKVAVMKGNDAMVISGLSDGKAGVNIKTDLDAAKVDKRFDDGTVMYAGHQVDDLFFAADDAELVGTDPNARWNEHFLDGHGGESQYDYAEDTSVSNSTSEYSDIWGSSNSIYAKLSSIINQLYEKLQGKDGNGGLLDMVSELTGDGDEGKLNEVMTKIEMVMNQISSLTQALSNIQKKHGDMMNTAANNLR